jgi:hypothetical protein
MERLGARGAALAAAGLALAALAGCGQPQASIRYTVGGPQEPVTYSTATFQLTRGDKVQILLFRRTAAPIGQADPDFEYTFFELPEKDRYGWLKEDMAPVYRWVREGGRDNVWLGASGQARFWWADNKQHVHFDFRVTMEPLRDTPGGAYFLTGNIKVTEDPERTQGLINQYGDWLLSLLGIKPAPSPALKMKSPLGGGSGRPSTKRPKPTT